MTVQFDREGARQVATNLRSVASTYDEEGRAGGATSLDGTASPVEAELGRLSEVTTGAELLLAASAGAASEEINRVTDEVLHADVPVPR